MGSCDTTDKLMYQYASSVRVKQLIRSMTAENCILQDVMDALRTRLDIDRSEGVQLDLIGEIVGVPRPLNIQIDPDEAFGFDEIAEGDPGFPSGYPPDFGWSGATRADRGGRFTGIDGLLVGRMVDVDYRTLIRARIFSNVAAGTVEDVLRFLEFVLGTPTSTLTIHSNRTVTINLGRYASGNEIDIITALVPFAAGIGIAAINQPA